MPRKRTADDNDDPHSHDEEKPNPKKSKDNAGGANARKARSGAATATAITTASALQGTQVDDNGDSYWKLNASGTRRATVSSFKSAHMVHIREFYEKDGAFLPGKKGISLPIDQFSAFIGVLPEIERALKEKGVGGIPRPVYGGDNRGEEKSVGEEVEEEEDQDTTGKKNYEATSDEDES